MKDDDGLKDLVTFTQAEFEQNNKLAQKIQQMFLQAHVEIRSKGTTDLTNMIRDEKQLYANLGIEFAVITIAATEKKKRG